MELAMAEAGPLGDGWPVYVAGVDGLERRWWLRSGFLGLAGCGLCRWLRRAGAGRPEQMVVGDGECCWLEWWVTRVPVVGGRLGRLGVLKKAGAVSLVVAG